MSRIANRHVSLFSIPKTASILCLGAHCDDVEIGCGGTLLRLKESHPKASLTWVVFASNSERAREARASANAFVKGFAHSQIIIHNYRDGFLPQVWNKVKEDFETLNRQIKTDLIFTHYRHDLHQDHRIISDLTWNTFRNHFILEYEIPKWDGDLGVPNTFFPFSDSVMNRKIALLLKYYRSQAQKAWFTSDLFSALPRLRGMECQARFAEAFYARKMIG